MLIENFYAFNTSIVLCSKNLITYSLPNVASKIIPLEDFEENRFSIELIYRPSILDNITSWKVFEGEEKILEFLTNGENFKDLSIDDDKF